MEGTATLLSNNIMMMRYIRYTLLILISLTCISCVAEIMSDESPTPDSENAISLSFRCEDVQQFGTRSEAPKEPEETNIKDLYVFFFNNSGNYLPLSTAGQNSSLFATTNGGVPYIHLIGGANSIVLFPNYFGTGANNAQIYAVANLEGFSPDQIMNLTSLTGYKYQPASEVNRELNKLPVSGMPMFGLLKTSLSQNASRTLSLKALMAKVEFVFGINSSNTDATGTYPQMSVQKLTFGNRPNGVILGDGSSTTQTTQFGTANNAVSKQDKNEFTKTFVLQHAGQTHTEIFYVYENIQPARNLSETPELSFLSETFEGKERYRAARANANASYVEIEGEYHDATKTEYKAKLIFHLGGNNYDNFEVKRNCHYKNSIFINGLQSNSTYDVKSVLYDSRVTVTTSGPYFVSMLKGQDVDAHFGVSPIDFYFYDDENVTAHRLKVEILDPTNDSWIRLEKVDAQYMQNSTLPSAWTSTHIDAGSGSWMAGHGKRKYFTTDLVTNTLNGNDNKQCYVTNHRDRVYLYIDENISKSNRSAQIKLTYEMQTKDKAQWHASPKAEDVTIDITQRGLLEFYNESDGKYYYIEQIEEYLDNYDPYDSYDSDQVYPGLPWGLNNKTIFSGEYKVDNYKTGAYATLYIIDNSNPKLTVLDLNTTPRAAAEYCYNKNKRNTNGTVANFNSQTASGWYLPSIPQLESLLVQHMGSFPCFGTEFYWSSSPGKEWGLFYYVEDPEHARATRYDYKNEVNGDYIPSAENNNYTGKDGIGGKAPRTEPLRIRAVYQKGNGQRL